MRQKVSTPARRRRTYLSGAERYQQRIETDQGADYGGNENLTEFKSEIL